MNEAFSQTVSAVKLRRLAVAAQGLDQRRPFGRGVAAVEQAVRHLGYVQIDTISVVQRAHHHVLWSRIPDYQPKHLDQLIRQQSLFEYWFHAAAYLPMEDFRYCLPRMQAIKSGEKHWFANIDPKLLREVMARIKSEGPLRARDFAADSKSGGAGWWDWKPAKQALEQLFMQGDLLIIGRDGFQKRYDLLERALPSHIDTRTPDMTEQAEYLIDTKLRALGFASLKSFTYLRKGAALRQAVKAVLAQREAEGVLSRVCNKQGDEFYLPAAALEQPGLRIGKRVRLLSPFDNLVIQRERMASIFDFDYQIECYVPAAKRQYGYFTLPVLYGDQLVARIDCKAHRDSRCLVINEFYPETKQQQRLDDGYTDFIDQLTVAVQEFAQFNDCGSVELNGTQARHYLAACAFD